MTEVEVDCPFCGETIVIMIDPSVDLQTYIEDCSVCCRPIQIAVECADGELQRVGVSKS